MSGMEPFFAVHELGHVYGRGTPLEVPSLNGVSLEVARGEIVGLVGPTGSGKSTLLQHLAGLIRPQTGSVRVDGIDLGDPGTDLRQIRQRVGLVFQSPEDQLFERYVGDDIAFGPRNQGLDRPAIRERVSWAMASVGLPFETFKDRLTLTLSGGERRKAALAGVLATQPDALLLDEPTAGLDPAGRRELLDLLKRWHSERRMTMVISSHNMDDLAELAGRLYSIRGGLNISGGPTRDFFAEGGILYELGLEPPAATTITDALIAAGAPVKRGALTLDEVVESVRKLWDGEA